MSGGGGGAMAAMQAMMMGAMPGGMSAMGMPAGMPPMGMSPMGMPPHMGMPPGMGMPQGVAAQAHKKKKKRKAKSADSSGSSSSSSGSSSGSSGSDASGSVVKPRERRRASSRRPPRREKRQPRETRLEEVDKFVEENRINDEAATKIRLLSPESQRKVIARPLTGDVQNPSKVMIARVREHQNQSERLKGGNDAWSMWNSAMMGASPDAISKYIDEHDLDETATRQLRSLPPHQQAVALTWDLSKYRNPSAKFMSMANSLGTSSSAAAPRMLPSFPGMPMMPGMPPGMPMMMPHMGMPMPGMMPGR